MIKRPLNDRFTDAVWSDIKTTTIRENPWPVGVPIMLYNWSGKPYRSPQINVAPVVVHATCPIVIRRLADGQMEYEPQVQPERELWETEGFPDQAAMDAWFSAKMQPGQVLERHLMFFKRQNNEY